MEHKILGKPNWWSWQSWRTNAVLLAFLAAVFGALMYVGDTNVAHNLITSDNRMVSAITYLLLGSWLGLIANYLFNKFAGRKIDGSYQGLQFTSWRFQAHAMGAGALAAVATFAYLFVAQEGDPSIIIVLTNFSLVYLAMYDWLKYRLPIKATLLAVILVLVGVPLVATNKTDGALYVTLSALVLLVFVNSGANAVSRILEKEAPQPYSTANFTFWRFLWLAISATILGLSIAVYNGITAKVFQLLQNLPATAFLWVALVMLLAYCSNISRIEAQKLSQLITVSVICSSQAIMAIPITMAVAWLMPAGTFNIPSDPSVWVLRLIGTLLIAAGIYICPKPQEKK